MLGQKDFLSLFPPHLQNEFSNLCVGRNVGGWLAVFVYVFSFFCLCFLLIFTMSSATFVLLERQVDVFLGQATDSRSDSLHTELRSAVSVTRLFSRSLSHKCCHSLPPQWHAAPPHHTPPHHSTPHHSTGPMLWHAIEAIGEPAHTRQTPTLAVCAPQLSYHQLCLLDSLYLSGDIHSRVNGLSHKSNVDHQLKNGFSSEFTQNVPPSYSYTI